MLGAIDTVRRAIEDEVACRIQIAGGDGLVLDEGMSRGGVFEWVASVVAPHEEVVIEVSLSTRGSLSPVVGAQLGPADHGGAYLLRFEDQSRFLLRLLADDTVQRVRARHRIEQAHKHQAEVRASYRNGPLVNSPSATRTVMYTTLILSVLATVASTLFVALTTEKKGCLHRGCLDGFVAEFEIPLQILGLSVVLVSLALTHYRARLSYDQGQRQVAELSASNYRAFRADFYTALGSDHAYGACSNLAN